MLKFIKLFVLFTSPILIGMVSFELLLRDIPNDYSYKRKYLDTKSNDIEVLFLGNSHIYFGINPTYMTDKSFNEAHISQSLNFDLAILEKYRNSWKDLKYVVIPIDYFSMYKTLEIGIEKWRVKNYSIYYDIPTNESYWKTLEVSNGKLHGNISRAKAYLFNRKSDVTCNELGFGTSYNSKDSKDLIETGKTAAKRHTIDIGNNAIDIENNMIFSQNVQTVKSIIEFSKRENVKIIFVTCPAYTSYKKNLNLNQLNNTINIINELSSKNTNTYYYNFIMDNAFVERDYFDADHLNEIGAKKFTLKIDSIINNIESTNAKHTFSKKAGSVVK